MTTEQIAILTKAVNHYGKDNQIRKAIEELAELIRALAIGNVDGVCDEMADVEIMMWQLRYIVGGGAVDNYVEHKIKRLRDRMEAEKMMDNY